MLYFKILHRTYYNFTDTVQLQPHVLRLRPRESAELKIETSSLKTTPEAHFRWHRDVEDNSVAIATFTTSTDKLLIESEVDIQQYNQFPLDFLVDDYATKYPFAYTSEDLIVLSPYMAIADQEERSAAFGWLSNLWQIGEEIQTYSLLLKLCKGISQRFSYCIREEPGVQTAKLTISRGTGSCRDFANLFIQLARTLGLAARFVSGYLRAPPSLDNYGATHAWAEVYLPGAGWKGFDPTIGDIVGVDHIAVAVSRLPESTPPVEGAYVGSATAIMDVGVWVTPMV